MTDADLADFLNRTDGGSGVRTSTPDDDLLPSYDHLSGGDRAGLEAMLADLNNPDREPITATPERIASILRMIEAYRDRKAARTRKKTCKRVRKHRAEKKATPAVALVVAPVPPLKAMLAALEQAVADRAATDRFLQNLVGREREIVRFRLVLELARRQLAKVSDAKLAAMYRARTGKPMDRNSAFRLGQIVKKLQARGIWSR